MLNESKMTLGQKLYYADTSGEVKEIRYAENLKGIIHKINTFEIKSDLLERCFEDKSEAKELVLEELGLKLHQAIDDKEAILWNIKQLKKKIKKQRI